MSTYRVTTVCLVEAESEEEALERESIEGGDIQEWYAEPAEEADEYEAQAREAIAFVREWGKHANPKDAPEALAALSNLYEEHFA